jgi:paraquat-inducible protein A/MlaD protein
VQRVEQLEPGIAAECYRCGWLISRRVVNSLSRTAAFSLAALIFYVPANILPILRMEYHGVHTENTIWDGCVRLFQDGQWPVAIIVFLASILIPLVKLLGLSFLVVTTNSKFTRWQRERTWIYKIIDVIGRLRRSATPIAREGAVFWIVRPEAGLYNIAALGTVFRGPEIEVLPGTGKAQSDFVGLESSPVPLEGKGLKVVLVTGHVGSLRPGSPVYYRGVEVGTIQDVRLSTNAAARKSTCLSSNGMQNWSGAVQSFGM